MKFSWDRLTCTLSIPYPSGKENTPYHTTLPHSISYHHLIPSLLAHYFKGRMRCF